MSHTPPTLSGLHGLQRGSDPMLWDFGLDAVFHDGAKFASATWRFDAQTAAFEGDLHPRGYRWTKTGDKIVTVIVTDTKGGKSLKSCHIQVGAAVITKPAPVNVTTAPPKVIEFSDFQGSHDRSATGSGISGSMFAGAGSTKTVYRMKPHSSTHKGAVPPDGDNTGGLANPTNNLSLMVATHDVTGLTLEGTDQGHLYNGLRFQGAGSPRLEDVRVLAIPGDSGANPGETFHVNYVRTTGLAVIRGVLVDGGKVGAAGIAMNSCSANFAIDGLVTRGLRYSAGIATWQQTGDLKITDWTHTNGARALGAERLSGTIDLIDPVWIGEPTKGHDVTYTWEGGYDGGSIRFRYTAAKNVPGRKTIIKVKGSGIKDSVRVWVAGVEKRASDYITFQ